MATSIVMSILSISAVAAAVVADDAVVTSKTVDLDQNYVMIIVA